MFLFGILYTLYCFKSGRSGVLRTIDMSFRCGFWARFSAANNVQLSNFNVYKKRVSKSLFYQEWMFYNLKNNVRLILSSTTSNFLKHEADQLMFSKSLSQSKSISRVNKKNGKQAHEYFYSLESSVKVWMFLKVNWTMYDWSYLVQYNK